MQAKDLKKYKELLLKEKSRLEEDLSGVAERDPAASKGWDVKTFDIEVDSADENEVADKFEELEDNAGIANQLENQLQEVDAALQRIERGTYGVCEKCGKPIEKDRLDANPSSRISIKHDHK